MLAVHVSLVIFVPSEALAAPSAIVTTSWASIAFDDGLCLGMLFSVVAFKISLAQVAFASATWHRTLKWPSLRTNLRPTRVSAATSIGSDYLHKSVSDG